MDKKVSIITPCFNGEKFLDRYFKSILNQTYYNIELIFINDGSTDKTEFIFRKYEKMLNERGIDTIYIFQENSGQAVALNKGLKKFTGDYIIWPDSDDFLTNDSILKKVEFLERNKDYGMVRTNVNIVNEDNINKIIGTVADNNKNKYKEKLFLDYILEDKVWFMPGSFMIRSEAFLDVIPNREIYESKGGQNWQILLPIMYKYKCGYIDECLYTYVIRKNSHSHKVERSNEIKKLFDRCEEHQDILINTIRNIKMPNEEKDMLIDMIKEKYLRKKYQISVIHRQKEVAKQLYYEIKELNKTKLIDKIFIIRNYSSIFNIVYIIFIKSIRRIRRCFI